MWNGWGSELTVAVCPLLFVQTTFVPALTVKTFGAKPDEVKVTEAMLTFVPEGVAVGVFVGTTVSA